MPAIPPAAASYAYTHVQPNGNRVLSGRGHVDETEPVGIGIAGTPAWLLAFGETASYWTVVTTDGTATTHRVGEGTSKRIAEHGEVSEPPLAYMLDGEVRFLERPPDGAARTHPVIMDDAMVYVAADGDLVVRRAESRSRLAVDAPGDVRLVAIDETRLALYGSQTDRYIHGALGDQVEGSSLVVVDVRRETVDVAISLDPPTVFEGLSPLVADIDGDGGIELVTTIADASDGARIRAYETDGTTLATGPVYGPGWRHQLCVARTGLAGVPELAVIRKPHVDRTLEFYRYIDDQLVVTATRQGYASHTYGSRNLDGGLAADLDSDGVSELLVPTTDRRTLAAIRRVDTGLQAPWSLSLRGPLTTNVTGVALEDDRVAVGAGTADGVRVWHG